MTSKQILSASGSSSLKVHSTSESNFPLIQCLDGAHKIGCHHIVTSANGTKAASAGFGGELRIWECQGDQWTEDGSVSGRKLTTVTKSPNFTLTVLFLSKLGLLRRKFGQSLFQQRGSILLEQPMTVTLKYGICMLVRT